MSVTVTGANYESNVIFSPSSYVPKSAMLNLTVDLFGESINLLEVSAPFLARGIDPFTSTIKHTIHTRL